MVGGKIIDFQQARAAREEQAALDVLKHQFVTEILPRMTPEDRAEFLVALDDPEKAQEVFGRILFRITIMQALDKIIGRDE